MLWEIEHEYRFVYYITAGYKRKLNDKKLSQNRMAQVGLIAITIALVAVSIQAIKAAFANPVKTLRSE